MKILFLTTDEEDYLEDSILHGLKNIYKDCVIDFPVKSIMYNNCPEAIRKKVRGNGFTLYFLLEGKEYGRQYMLNDLRRDTFDYIIFSSIQRQIGLYLQFLPYLSKKKTIIIDGEDTPAMFSYHGYYWRKIYAWFIPSPNKKFIYYKREWTQETKSYRYYKLVPKSLLKYFPDPKNLKKISFSIPEEKIIKKIPLKTKIFPKHIVDEEIADKVEGSLTEYAFNNEMDYYTDLQLSKYGITMKRSGWDCLRHYEIAANGAVICFKNLDSKPETCAPHGLIPGINCLSYKNYSDLMNQMANINATQYKNLQINSFEWIRKNTTKDIASRIIKEQSTIL